MDTELRNPENLREREASVAYPYSGACHHAKGISWSAILTGALIGMGISFIFNLFAVGIGLTAFVTTTANAKTIAVGGLIGLLLISIFSMGTAGWVAGYLGRQRSLHRDMGVIYGFTTWAVALVLTVLLSANFDKFVSYNLLALQNPSNVLTNVDKNTSNVPNSNVINVNEANPQTPTDNQKEMNSEDATKSLALTSLIAFVLAFFGGIASCIGGHWGFRSYEKDILYYTNRDTRI